MPSPGGPFYTLLHPELHLFDAIALLGNTVYSIVWLSDAQGKGSVRDIGVIEPKKG